MYRMYVASIRLDFYEEWMERTERNLDARLDLLLTRNLITSVDYLSRETYAKHGAGAKAFWPLIVVSRTP